MKVRDLTDLAFLLTARQAAVEIGWGNTVEAEIA
jgi:hypothetical protein